MNGKSISLIQTPEGYFVQQAVAQLPNIGNYLPPQKKFTAETQRTPRQPIHFAVFLCVLCASAVNIGFITPCATLFR